jgi:hypothetical protein
MAVYSTSKDTFFDSVKKYGISRPNRFEVLITSAGDKSEYADDNFVALWCQSVDIPGRTMESQPNENIYGPSHEIAQGIVLTGTIEMTFLLDENYNIKRYFDNWQKKIYDPNTYDMYYYSNYVRDMTIKQLSKNDDIVFQCKVYEAFPKTVELISLNANNRSEASTLSVTMSFRDWIEE